METPHHHLKLRSGNFSIENHHHENIGLTERMVSVFLGGAILSRTFYKPFKKRFWLGAYLTYRGVTGQCLVYDKLGIDGTNPKAVNIRGEFVIDKSPAEVYTYWRDLDNLPEGLRHLLTVKVTDSKLSSWKSNVLGRLFPLNWTAEIVKDEPGYLIGWRSMSGTMIHHVGKVTFESTPDQVGTLLKVVLSYHPPIGGVGIGLAKVVNPFLEGILKKEIKNFNQG